MTLKPIARELRRNQTDEEKELWRALRGRRFAGFKFRRQHAVGGHILDFYCADAKLAVELEELAARLYPPWVPPAPSSRPESKTSSLTMTSVR